jgi:FixJ family two-component response regulator
MRGPSESQPVVFVVDDDESIREALRSLLRSVGLRVELFGAASEFLKSKLPDAPSCLVLDVRLPGLSGLDFQTELARANVNIPIIFITGHGDIPMTVRAMKAAGQHRARRQGPFQIAHAARAGSNGLRHCRIDEQADRGEARRQRDHGEGASWQRHAQNERALARRSRAHGRRARH